jgi:serine/threonine protein kinase
MEYADGGELFNYIVNNKRLDETEASYFYVQIINGLEHIHKNNIVHRDLKPENLLISEGRVLKIIDFGLSNSYKNGQLLQTPCGSPCYAAPEMILGKRYTGINVDIWSTGIILYAMVCGYLPFEDKNNNKLYKKILECKLDFPGYLSEHCKDFIKKILTTNPQKRIKLEEIKKHTFFKVGEMLANRSQANNKSGNPAFKQQVMDKMINIGVKNTEMGASNLDKNETQNNVTTTQYDLMMNKLTSDDRPRQDSPIKPTSGNINININCATGVKNININIKDSKKEESEREGNLKPLDIEDLEDDELCSERSPRVLDRNIIEKNSASKASSNLDSNYFNTSSVGFVDSKLTELKKKIKSTISSDTNAEYLQKSLDSNIIRKQKLDLDGREFAYIYKNYQNKVNVKNGSNNKLSYNFNSDNNLSVKAKLNHTGLLERNSLGLTVHRKSETVTTNTQINTTQTKEMDIIPEDLELSKDIAKSNTITIASKHSKIQTILTDFHKKRKNLSIVDKNERYI